jgi:hypothetical protein
VIANSVEDHHCIRRTLDPRALCEHARDRVEIGQRARPLAERQYEFLLVAGFDWGHARQDSYLEGDAMAKSLRPATRPHSTARRGHGSSISPKACAGARAGDIGPIRREIIFEPVHERPPVEAPPAAPEPEPQEPVPDRT